MKKWLSAVLCFVLLFVSMAGCGEAPRPRILWSDHVYTCSGNTAAELPENAQSLGKLEYILDDPSEMPEMIYKGINVDSKYVNQPLWRCEYDLYLWDEEGFYLIFEGERTDEPAGTDQTDISADAEMVSYICHSLDELVSQIKEISGENSFFAPDMAAFSGYRLFQIEVLPESIIYYLIPGDAEYFDYSNGITVTFFRSSDVTLVSLSAQVGPEISDEGFIYDPDIGDISFEAESSVISIHAPEALNDYEKLKSFCYVEKVTVE